MHALPIVSVAHFVLSEALDIPFTAGALLVIVGIILMPLLLIKS